MGEWAFTTTWRIYQGTWETFSVLELEKPPSHPASFFMLWEQQVRCCLRQHYKPKAPAFVPRPEGSGGERRPGKFNKSVPSSSTPFRVSFPWALDFNARHVREARGTSWLGRSRGLPKMPRQVPGEAGTTDLLIPTGPHSCTGLDTLPGTSVIISSWIPKPLCPCLPQRGQPSAGLLVEEEDFTFDFAWCSLISWPYSPRRWCIC